MTVAIHMEMFLVFWIFFFWVSSFLYNYSIYPCFRSRRYKIYMIFFIYWTIHVCVENTFFILSCIINILLFMLMNSLFWFIFPVKCHAELCILILFTRAIFHFVAHFLACFSLLFWNNFFLYFRNPNTIAPVEMLWKKICFNIGTFFLGFA